MIVIRAHDVNEALPKAIQMLQEDTARTIAPRDGQKTLEFSEPVCTVYELPKQRVLFNAARNANPFFHLMESLWILRGRADVKWLAQFNQQMKAYSDDGLIFHAPYGYRLRSAHNIDQIEEIIDLLHREHSTRRAVLTIWKPTLDLNVESKDIPCNDMIFFKIRERRLHMTVCCRSNDLIWGAYGANIVQFSMLQEYIAAMVGVEVGEYRQISDSLHVYVDNPLWAALKDIRPSSADTSVYEKLGANPIPLIVNPKCWDDELQQFFIDSEAGIWDPSHFKEPFFRVVALPAHEAWFRHKSGDTRSALEIIKHHMPHYVDWTIAMVQWLERRLKAKENLNA